jgi:hypothetical protein
VGVGCLNNLGGLVIGIIAILLLTVTVSAAITTNIATVNATCVVFSGTNSGVAEQVYFDYGHTTNPNFSSSTPNKSAAGTFTVKRCDEPTFLPAETYKYRACGKTSGCGDTVIFTMNAIVPHETSNFSVQGEEFIANGGDIGWIAAHIWDVYTLVWGSFFFLLLIGFVFMNITIKQKSVTISLLLVLISGSVLFTIAPPQTAQIAQILIALSLTGLVIWFVKRR